MRKHRFYGVVLAMLLCAGVLTQSPRSTHQSNSTNKSNSTHRSDSTHESALRRSARTDSAGPSSSATERRRPVPVRFAGKEGLLAGNVSRSTGNVYGWSAGGPTAAHDPSLLGPAISLIAFKVPLSQPTAPTPVRLVRESTSAPAAPAPGPQPAPAPGPQPLEASAGVWAELRHCESDGDYAEDTGNGYYGAYQFSLGTWESLGFSGLPSEAPAAEQDRAAEQLQARNGWGQWPSCSRQLGLV
jgi:Transglycosylase-like domain